MLAVDTNVIVRYLTGDDPEQQARARRCLETNETFVPITVSLETEWVLRRIYRYSKAQIAAAFKAFAGLPGVAFEDATLVVQAIDWMLTKDMDFADALHLSKAAGCTAFMTFDKKAAKELEGIPVRLP